MDDSTLALVEKKIDNLITKISLLKEENDTLVKELNICKSGKEEVKNRLDSLAQKLENL